MIFLSHHHKDKPIVEPIALRLRQIYGEEKIFYDSWSILPGEGIIDKMNEGLEKTSHFFLFVSSNSLASDMVKLEWQNALYKATKGQIVFTPVRLDLSMMPAILCQTLYIDMFNNGFEFCLNQMKDVINNTSNYKPQYTTFCTSSVVVKRENPRSVVLCFFTKYILEPVPRYCVIFENDINTISFRVLSDAGFYGGPQDRIKAQDGSIVNGFFIAPYRSIAPGFPFRVRVTSTAGEIIIKGISKEIREDVFELVPIVSEQEFLKFQIIRRS